MPNVDSNNPGPGPMEVGENDAAHEFKGRPPAGPNELGRMPEGVLESGANLDRVHNDQADAEERAGHGEQDRPADAGPIVEDHHSDSSH